MTRLQADFKEFLRSLNAQRVEYLLIGGYAVGFHGYPRATVDLDVWIKRSKENATRVIAALEVFGFTDARLTPDLLLQADQILRLGLPPFRIEIATTISGVEFAGCYAGRVNATIDGIDVPVINLADLRKNKKAAGRHKDLDDLENLPSPSDH